MVRILEEYAEKNNIPIMQKDGIEFLLKYREENNIKTVTTIERDKERYDLEVKNISDFNLNNQIEIILSDAFDVELKDKYDLIFIDAAKSQYIKFFEKFKNNLSNKGVIVSDNLNFHGLTKVDESTLSRNVRGLVRKLNNYVEFLENNQEFDTTFYNFGDGVSISKRK